MWPPTHDPNTSRMTIVVVGDDKVLDQVVKQLNRLVDVIEIHDFQRGEYVDRELILVKVKVNKSSRAEIMQICDIFRAKIVDVQSKNMSIEITGDGGKIEKFIALMDNFGITDIVRTGRVALPRN
jgi:acetolactate synthase-1/3 small subunit